MRKIGKIFSSRIVLLLFIFPITVKPQVELTKGWKYLVEKDSLKISFLFYSKADNFNNGVVLKIENQNHIAADYNFDLIFRSEYQDKIEKVSGHINPNQIKAGSNDSLFWVPFGKGKHITEVGITNLRVIKKEKE